jgi:hypothetical protein
MKKYRKQIIAGFAIALAIYVFLLIFMDGSEQFGDGVWDELRRFPLWLIPVLALTQVSFARISAARSNSWPTINSNTAIVVADPWP